MVFRSSRGNHQTETLKLFFNIAIHLMKYHLKLEYWKVHESFLALKTLTISIFQYPTKFVPRNCCYCIDLDLHRRTFSVSFSLSNPKRLKQQFHAVETVLTYFNRCWIHVLLCLYLIIDKLFASWWSLINWHFSLVMKLPDMLLNKSIDPFHEVKK